jgi:hypothetical protein
MAVWAVKLRMAGAGIEIGQETGDKVGMYGVTPVDQGAVVAVPTDLATSITSITALISRLEDLGVIAAN